MATTPHHTHTHTLNKHPKLAYYSSKLSCICGWKSIPSTTILESISKITLITPSLSSSQSNNTINN